MLASISVYAQSDDNATLDFYGFVRIDAYTDTYKGVDAGHDVFYLLPLYAKPGGVEDFNEQRSSNITAIASRLGVKIKFPEVAGAKVTGLIEFDFAGNLKADPTLFRIRQAYSLLTWEKSSLLLGQTWHPFFGNSNVPVVAGLNTGAPFSCFNRSPMIRYNMKMGGLTVSASAVSEMQYTSPMMDQADYSYLLTSNHAMRNGVIPELVLSAEWTKNSVTLGTGVASKRIKPRMMASGTNGNSKADEFLSSTAFMAYGRYKKEKFTVIAKSFIGENMSHMVMPGGYGIATRNVATGEETYTSYTTWINSLSMVYGTKWQFGLFAGYGSNLGTKDALWDSGDGKAKTCGSFLNMQTMYRVAPHISLNLNKFKVIAEYEKTSANYGTGTINLADGLYNSTHRATNNRIIVMISHYF
ncbi:MAG TPA: hypothetical protein DD458_06385 [Prolixibacteraceae bacterium]|nr:MAG: hypothetical protein A2W89_02980 [Bacteroidetes bacterium GWE2_42_39]HBL74844.1 hypothetical protein [Prolixibacteraceae bacterium]